MFICCYLLQEGLLLIRTPDLLPLAQHYSMPLVAVKKNKEITEEKVCSDRRWVV